MEASKNHRKQPPFNLVVTEMLVVNIIEIMKHENFFLESSEEIG